MSLAIHIGALALLLIDLSLAGQIISRNIGRYPTIVFEFGLILGYVFCVLQWYPWKRNSGS